MTTSNTFTFSQVKTIKTFCDDLFSEPCYREVIENEGNDDFEINNVRFIKVSEIDEILAKELKSDLYCLGCFNAGFISNEIGIDLDVIEALKGAEAYEALGKLIISQCDMKDFASSAASVDGYGHHFNHYDGAVEEITIDGIDYLVFDKH